jgi:predicted alpha/beta-hydrolase family hydrolase
LSDAVFVCAHGAGGHKDDRGMLALAQVLEGIGVQVVRFNFPYREKGSGRPDPMAVLKSSVASTVSRVREEFKPKRLFMGGRSMGGRAATMLAADGFKCDGLMLFAYPLHPAGQPEKLRAAHLPQIEAPVLCFNGTRDALCTRELMEKHVPPAWTMHWLEGADHSFHVLKSSGRTDREVLAEVGTVSAAWLRAVPASPR